MALRNERFRDLPALPTIASKEPLRRLTRAKMDEFEAKGGKVTICPPAGSGRRATVEAGILDGRPAVSRVKRSVPWHPLIEQAVNLLGGQAKAALALDVSPGTIRKWGAGEYKMTPAHATKIERLTRGRIRADQLPQRAARG